METAKAITGAFALIITALTTAFADDVFDISDAGQVTSTVVVAALGVYAIWRIPNKTKA